MLFRSVYLASSNNGEFRIKSKKRRIEMTPGVSYAAPTYLHELMTLKIMTIENPILSKKSKHLVLRYILVI